MQNQLKQPPKLSIREIKETILRRARERQTKIERGEHDVPLHYTPLPLAKLFDLLGQLEYRENSLSLAVPPAEPGLGNRIKRSFKGAVCKSLRWLLIRQVEYNQMAILHAREAGEVLATADRNLGEFLAALKSQRLQINALVQRVATLETQLAQVSSYSTEEIALPAEMPASPSDQSEVHQAYASRLKQQLPVLVLGDPRGDFLRALVSEGVEAQGVDADIAVVDYCRERELPIAHARPAEYIQGLEDGSLGGIFLGQEICRRPARELNDLLGQCWLKLAKNCNLIAETGNPLKKTPTFEIRPARERLCTELLCLLLEGQCYTVVDFIFSIPSAPDSKAVARTSMDDSFDQKLYRDYAVVGRK